MKWEELLNVDISNDYNGQVLTDIECPVCGKHVYLNNQIVLTTYPAQYEYWCSCGWVGHSYVKRSRGVIE